MQVTAVTHRANPIYAAMVPGRPPHEAVTVARAMQRVLRSLARLAMPELVDYDLPEFAAARFWAAVSIRKTYPGQGRRAAHAAWNLPAIKFAKMLVIVDGDVDVRDHQQVLAAVAANVRPGRNVLVEDGPADPFDPATRAGAWGRKWPSTPRENLLRNDRAGGARSFRGKFSRGVDGHFLPSTPAGVAGSNGSAGPCSKARRGPAARLRHRRQTCWWS